jgi:asparagine synthase (glutamine-hydrolysing)
MCGIAGVLYRDPARPADQAVLAAMGESIAHRGPDGEGFFSAPGVGLVHRRLAIIDLAGGRQPLGNEDDSVQVVFNGEIYNYQGLRADLEAKGHRFRTNSDTEVLVHLYEEEGEGLVERLRGMFAFAVWDAPSRRLLLARDRLGIKPLYYCRDGEKLVFGSELKALLMHPGVGREVDPAALEDYLGYGMVSGERAIFRGVRKLPPGHTLLIQPGGWDRAPRSYWQIRRDPDESLSFEQWQQAVRAKVHEAVKLHLIADVPVGAFLSGGVDSSVVVSASAGATQGALRTFSIGFQEEAYSELPYAREVARQFGAQHTEEVVTPDAVSLLDDLTWYYDEPFADTSAIPTFLVSRLASRHVKVVLSGDGGDEAFGGYSRYAHDLREAAIRRRLPLWLRRGVLGPVARVWPKADWLPRPLRARTALTNLSLDADAAYANTLALCRPPMRRRLLAADLAATLNGHDSGRLIRTSYAAAPASDPLSGMLAADLATVLPDDFLVKVDRASMANGLEVRPPLLDHELMELAARIPSRWKVQGKQTKVIFKRAFEARLPSSVTRRPKQGFELPIDGWLRGPLRETFEGSVLRPGAAVNGLIDQGVVRGLYRSHLAGVGRHGGVLWALLVLARWADQYLGAEPPRGPAPGRGRVNSQGKV